MKSPAGRYGGGTRKLLRALTQNREGAETRRGLGLHWVLLGKVGGFGWLRLAVTLALPRVELVGLGSRGRSLALAGRVGLRRVMVRCEEVLGGGVWLVYFRVIFLLVLLDSYAARAIWRALRPAWPFMVSFCFPSMMSSQCLISMSQPPRVGVLSRVFQVLELSFPADAFPRQSWRPLV